MPDWGVPHVRRPAAGIVPTKILAFYQIQRLAPVSEYCDISAAPGSTAETPSLFNAAVFGTTSSAHAAQNDRLLSEQDRGKILVGRALTTQYCLSELVVASSGLRRNTRREILS